MKRFIILLMVVCLYYPSYAQEYQLAEIEELANSFFNKESHSNYRNGGIEKQIASIDSVIRDGTNYMYIVNATDSAGWVILPNEKSYPITIAHADNDSFVYDTEMLPPALVCIYYYSLDFAGYYQNQTYLIELYPNCDTRSSDISLNTTDNILANDNRTYYSTNDIVFCSNNNAITVNNGGHLLVKSNGLVRLNSGFHAKAGSDVRITTTESLCYDPTAVTSSNPQRIAPNIQDNTEPTDEVGTSNSFENIKSDMIQSTAIYTISGQLLQTIEGDQRDAAHLPNGMYILQHHMNDGSLKSTKIIR